MSFIPPFRRLPTSVITIVAILCGTVVAQEVVRARADRPQDKGNDMEALIAQALDQKTNLDLKDKPIGEALELLGGQTGIPIAIEPGTLRLLPNDARTMLSATIQNKPLREVLTALLRPIALQFDVEGERLVIRPIPPLRRAPQRATWTELALLDKLGSTPWSDDFAKSLKFQFQRTPLSLADVNRKTLMELAAKAGEGTASEVLELATHHYGWTWHVAEDVIVVLPKTRQIELQLERRISADYTQTSVQDALLDLAERAGVPLRCDPGAFASLSPFVAERFHLKVVNTPIRQAFELVAGQTGLGYYIEPEGVRIAASILGPTGTPTVTSASGVEDTVKRLRENSVVLHLELPATKDGRKFTIMVRGQDLPPDVRAMINTAITDSIEPIRLALQTTTRPHD